MDWIVWLFSTFVRLVADVLACRWLGYGQRFDDPLASSGWRTGMSQALRWALAGTLALALLAGAGLLILR